MVKNAPPSAGDWGSIPGLGRSPGEGKGNQLQYSCLEKPMIRGAWQATVHRFGKSQTRLSNQHVKKGFSQYHHFPTIFLYFIKNNYYSCKNEVKEMNINIQI